MVVRAPGDRSCMVGGALGTEQAYIEVEPGKAERIILPACSVDEGSELVLSIDAARGGIPEIISAQLKRVYGVNFIRRGSFEVLQDGLPVGLRPGTITKNAACKIESASGGRTGERCLKVICTKATGGDFGVIFTWSGIPAVSVDRRFRISCWVKTDAASVVGLQVASRDWRFWKNTPRLQSKGEWAEAAEGIERANRIDSSQGSTDHVAAGQGRLEAYQRNEPLQLAHPYTTALGATLLPSTT